MDKGFSRVYQRYLLNLLKANASRKLEAYPGSLPVSLAQLKSLRRIRDFDDLITAKIQRFRRCYRLLPPVQRHAVAQSDRQTNTDYPC